MIERILDKVSTVLVYILSGVLLLGAIGFFIGTIWHDGWVMLVGYTVFFLILWYWIRSEKGYLD